MIAFRASRHNHPRGLDRSFGSNGRQEYNGTCGARFQRARRTTRDFRMTRSRVTSGTVSTMDDRHALPFPHGIVVRPGRVTFDAVVRPRARQTRQPATNSRGGASG